MLHKMHKLNNFVEAINLLRIIFVFLFVCLLAVHFEVVDYLSTDSFMNGFSKSSYKTCEMSRQ